MTAFRIGRALAAAAVAAVFSATAPAADPVDPARLAEAKALLDAMEVDKQLGDVLQALSRGMAKNLAGASADPRETQLVMETVFEVQKEMAARPGGMWDAVTHAYATTFTLEELRELTLFHGSAVAQKQRERAPALMQRMIEAGVVGNPQRLREMCQTVRDRLKGKRAATAATMKCPGES